VALIKNHPKFDGPIILVGWLLPAGLIVAYHLRHGTFLESYRTEFWDFAMVMTWSTNVLTMIMAYVLNKDEHLEKMMAFMDAFPEFKDKVLGAIDKIEGADPIALVREHRAEIIEILNEDPDDGQDPFEAFDASAIRERLR